MPSTATILSDSAPSATPMSRIRLLLQSVRAAALDAIAECGSGLTALARAAQADAVHDQHLVVAARTLAMGSEEAQVRGCGCASRFDRAGRLVAGAQQADAQEDAFVQRAGRYVGRGCDRMRTVAGAADREIGGSL